MPNCIICGKEFVPYRGRKDQETCGEVKCKRRRDTVKMRDSGKNAARCRKYQETEGYKRARAKYLASEKGQARAPKGVSGLPGNWKCIAHIHESVKAGFLCKCLKRVTDGASKNCRACLDKASSTYRAGVDRMLAAGTCRSCWKRDAFNESGMCQPCLDASNQRKDVHRLKRAEWMARASEKIKRIDVYERDGWRCGICGRKVKASMWGKHKPGSPTMDHIIPLSKGGTHTMSNVQLAHRRCNIRKQAKLIEAQMKLALRVAA